ncbi:MAG: ATP-dependent sacrificial sulfur transferase LarE [Fibrobacteres bacterium]|nr:ATP-dependent sacrificial sulfur transferase LarE [Fibrobacterota bacterium]
MGVDKKLERLHAILRGMQRVAIAFSGGVDSVFLARAAVDVLGTENVGVFTAVSASYPAREREESERLASSFGVKQYFFETRETDSPLFAKNPVDRCYHCKLELYRKLTIIAETKGFANILDGSNIDDISDYRPGLKALEELKIRSPLKEAGLTKEEIRLLSKKLGLPTWNKQAFACLSSRFQYGDSITPEKLKKVEIAEEYLRDAGFAHFRVRDHGNLVRIETGEKEIDLFFDKPFRKRLVEKLKSLGYNFISLDLEGYRTGSMNEALKQ